MPPGVNKCQWPMYLNSNYELLIIKLPAQWNDPNNSHRHRIKESASENGDFGGEREKNWWQAGKGFRSWSGIVEIDHWNRALLFSSGSRYRKKTLSFFLRLQPM